VWMFATRRVEMFTWVSPSEWVYKIKNRYKLLGKHKIFGDYKIMFIWRRGLWSMDTACGKRLWCVDNLFNYYVIAVMNSLWRLWCVINHNGFINKLYKCKGHIILFTYWYWNIRYSSIYYWETIILLYVYRLILDTW
jgi:hypothetical protein